MNLNWQWRPTRPVSEKGLLFRDFSSKSFILFDAALYSGLDVSKVPLFDYESPEQARLFAHELTLIVRQHFVAIKESEIVNFITHAGPHVLVVHISEDTLIE